MFLMRCSIAAKGPQYLSSNAPFKMAHYLFYLAQIRMSRDDMYYAVLSGKIILISIVQHQNLVIVSIRLLS